MEQSTLSSTPELKEIVISREFDAPRERVWKAWTDPEMVKQWWGPEPFTAPTVRIDLRIGGKYVWSMRGPTGSQWDMEMYNAGIYKEIVRNAKLVVTQYMSDADGNMIDATKYGQHPDFPNEMMITVLFEAIGAGRTRLSIVYPRPENEKQLQAMLKSGMTEGWNSSLNKLARSL